MRRGGPPGRGPGPPASGNSARRGSEPADRAHRRSRADPGRPVRPGRESHEPSTGRTRCTSESHPTITRPGLRRCHTRTGEPLHTALDRGETARMGYQNVRIERSGDFATVTMDNPAKRNALSRAHMRELIAA